ncbi:MAG TPA: sensor histidine kinase [Candidatus Sulfotelmatobacter sp.]|jgi:two-component system sensor histidine kinase DesK|nr:sensor histidine kinase [Candidatus Sulfotelmatobacter sp.]
MPLIPVGPETSCETAGPFTLKPWRTIFRDREHGWSPLFWVIYLGFFFIQPVMDHVSLRMWVLDGLGAVVFLFLFFGLFVLAKPRSLAHIAGMVLLGLLYQPINGGACTFFIFAAAMLPFCVESQVAAVIGLLTIGATGAIEGLLLHVGGWQLFYSALFPVIIGAGNTFFAERNRMNRRLRKANDEIEHLAKVAERERIARDLHDVLGHTLSVITLKSELAGKLIDRDPQRAGREIREVEEISRQALSDVRDAIRGYRSKGLVAELAQAKCTLETAGVAVRCDASTTMKLPAMQESVLSMAVREAVTNVVRHAQAHTCTLRLDQHNGTCHLEIEDDGRGGFQSEGNGLRGMRERVEMLGGTLTRDSRAGTKLAITLPVKEVALKSEDVVR